MRNEPTARRRRLRWLRTLAALSLLFAQTSCAARYKVVRVMMNDPEGMEYIPIEITEEGLRRYEDFVPVIGENGEGIIRYRPGTANRYTPMAARWVATFKSDGLIALLVRPEGQPDETRIHVLTERDFHEIDRGALLLPNFEQMDRFVVGPFLDYYFASHAEMRGGKKAKWKRSPEEKDPILEE